MELQGNSATLPPELYLSIIQCLIPPGSKPPLAFTASNITTKTLLSLARTSRTTYPMAVALLYSHCLYIDSPRRLICLLNTLTQSRKPLPEVSRLQHITSLYLAPFDNNTENHVQIGNQVHELCILTAPNLRNLIADIPLSVAINSTYNDPTVLRELRNGFSLLTSLEFYCNIHDDFSISQNISVPIQMMHPVWSLWTQLQTLALYSVAVPLVRFWDALAELEALKQLVLVKSYGHRVRNMKHEWSLRVGKDRPLDIWLLDIATDHEDLLGSAGYKEEDKVKIHICNVPTSYYGDEDADGLCKDWTRRIMLRKELPEHEFTV